MEGHPVGAEHGIPERCPADNKDQARCDLKGTSCFSHVHCGMNEVSSERGSKCIYKIILCCSPPIPLCITTEFSSSTHSNWASWVAQLLKNLPAVQETPIPGSGSSPAEGMAYPLKYSWASLVAQMVKNLPFRRHGFDPWVGKIPWRRAWQPTPVLLPGESPWTEVSGGLQSTGSHRVRHD